MNRLYTLWAICSIGIESLGLLNNAFHIQEARCKQLKVKFCMRLSKNVTSDRK